MAAHAKVIKLRRNKFIHIQINYILFINHLDRLSLVMVVPEENH